jgi:hypothetical protein
MSHDEDPSKRRPYKVGYGKPPEEHQFKVKDRDRDPADTSPRPRKRRKGTADEPEQVDLARLFAEPVIVAKGGRAEKMDAHEAMLRKLVERAVKKRSVSAMKAVVAVGPCAASCWRSAKLILREPADHSNGRLSKSLSYNCAKLL